MVSVNRVPSGYSIYIAGEADNIAAGTFGGGTQLKFDGTNTQRDFQLLSHVYVIGAKGIWENCSMENYFNTTLIAPASTGLTNVAGNFNKQALGGGLNMIVPVGAGTGAWSMDLTAKLTNTQILKATPVPSTGNVGWFDYDPDTNVLTPNMDHVGGYNLFDFEAKLHAFSRKIWGRAQNGSESSLEIGGMVGKMFFNFWKIRFNFELTGGLFGDDKAAIVLILASKQNI